MSSYHAEGSGVISVRTEPGLSGGASMLAVICGPDLEGHADRATGDWMFWAGGEFLVTTPKIHIGNGVSTQATQYHNVILVDGRGLDTPDKTLVKAPGKIHIFEDDGRTARLRMEYGGAYDLRRWPNPNKLLASAWRDILWYKPGFLICSDRIEKSKSVIKNNIPIPGESQVITWAVHLPYEPKPQEEGLWIVRGRNASLLIDFRYFGNPEYQTVVEKLPDTAMTPPGPGCWRLKRIAPSGRLTDEFNAIFQVRPDPLVPGDAPAPPKAKKVREVPGDALVRAQAEWLKKNEPKIRGPGL